MAAISALAVTPLSTSLSAMQRLSTPPSSPSARRRGVTEKATAKAQEALTLAADAIASLRKVTTPSKAQPKTTTAKSKPQRKRSRSRADPSPKPPPADLTPKPPPADLTPKPPLEAPPRSMRRIGGIVPILDTMRATGYSDSQVSEVEDLLQDIVNRDDV